MQTKKTKTGLRYREKVLFEGKEVCSPWFRGKTDCKTWKRNTLRERDKLRAMGISKFDNRTFKEYAEAWLLKKSDLEKKTIEGYTSILNCHIFPVFGKMKIKSIRLTDGDSLKTDLLKEGRLSRVRINHILKVLKMVANDAVKTGTLTRSPFFNLDNLRVQSKSKTYWLPREVNQFLLANIDDYYYSLYCFMLNTGIRPSEARGLMWDKVDFEGGKVEISRSQDRYEVKENTKSKKARVLRLNKVTKELLIRLRENTSSLSHVFTQPNGDPLSMHLGDRTFPRAIEHAKVRKIQLRHLRSTFASNFVMNGGSVFTLSKILGHHSVQITEERYADLHSSFMEKEAEIVSFEATNRAHLGLISEECQ